MDSASGGIEIIDSAHTVRAKVGVCTIMTSTCAIMTSTCAIMTSTCAIMTRTDSITKM